MNFFVAIALFQNCPEKKKIFWQHSQFQSLLPAFKEVITTEQVSCPRITPVKKIWII